MTAANSPRLSPATLVALVVAQSVPLLLLPAGAVGGPAGAAVALAVALLDLLAVLLLREQARGNLSLPMLHTVKVFISWSGSKSQQAALALHDWLPQIVNAVEPFVSEQDIEPGTRGLEVIARELADSQFGIICVTATNWSQPWVNYEAGALSKQVDISRVVPVLLDVGYTDISGPLTQFQNIKPVEGDMRRLVRSINRFCNPPRPERQLDAAFDKWWPDLDKTLLELRSSKEGEAPKRETRELVEEAVTLLRDMQSWVTQAASRGVIYLRYKATGDKEAHRRFWLALLAHSWDSGTQVIEDVKSSDGWYIVGFTDRELEKFQSWLPGAAEYAGISARDVEIKRLS